MARYMQDGTVYARPNQYIAPIGPQLIQIYAMNGARLSYEVTSTGEFIYEFRSKNPGYNIFSYMPIFRLCVLDAIPEELVT